MRIRRCALAAAAIAMTSTLVSGPPANAEDPTSPPAAPAEPAPAPPPHPVQPPAPAAPVAPPPAAPEAQQPAPPSESQPQGDQLVGGEPQEIIEPPQQGGVPSRTQQQQAQEAAIAEDRAREAAAAAVSEARVAYERALAEHRIAKFKVHELLRKSRRAEEQATRLTRDLGNLARMAYSSGNRDMNLFAILLEADSPEQLLAGAGAAERVAEHKQDQLYDARDLQAESDELAATAQRLSDQTAADLAAAKQDLDEAMSLARAVDAAIDPPKKFPPVDLKTKSDWVFPTPEGKIDSEAGMRMHPILHYLRCHAGADISVPSGTPIYSVDDGVVLSAGVNGGYGNYTLVAHGNGLTSAYAHQQMILVKAGDRVTKGQLIGEVGTTGLSTGPHLHFEAAYHGVPYNPRGWLEDHPELRTQVC